MPRHSTPASHDVALVLQRARAHADGWTVGDAACGDLAADAVVQSCWRGCHLVVAYQPRRWCRGCGQPLPSTTAPTTRLAGERADALSGGCVLGRRNHAHACGTWNAPLEVLVDVGAEAQELAGRVVDALGADEATYEARRRRVDITDDVVAARIHSALGDVGYEVSQWCDQQEQALRERLAAHLTSALRRRTPDAAPATPLPHDTTLSVTETGGGLRAWAPHPCRDYGDVVVTEEELSGGVLAPKRPPAAGADAPDGAH